MTISRIQWWWLYLLGIIAVATWEAFLGYNENVVLFQITIIIIYLHWSLFGRTDNVD